MKLALKITSLLLSYPTQQLIDEIPQLIDALRESTLAKAQKDRLASLAKNIGELDLYDAQERYVHLFDRTRSLSLHLFEHVHGESRDRGQAMVDLKEMYDAQGLEIEAKELPDHLPVFLEFLSTQSEDDARELLGQTAHILAFLRERLKKRKSIYAKAFQVLEALAAGKAEKGLLEELLAQPDDDPDDLEALDEVWEEEVVTFGGNAGENACGPDRLQRQIRAAARKAPGVESPTINTTRGI
ncbi:MAG: nitrate reductase molybdenum cofactor assembly chaperone [Rhizobiaceae bacterium]